MMNRTRTTSLPKKIQMNLVRMVRLILDLLHLNQELPLFTQWCEGRKDILDNEAPPSEGKSSASEEKRMAGLNQGLPLFTQRCEGRKDIWDNEAPPSEIGKNSAVKRHVELIQGLPLITQRCEGRKDILDIEAPPSERVPQLKKKDWQD